MESVDWVADIEMDTVYLVWNARLSQKYAPVAEKGRDVPPLLRPQCIFLGWSSMLVYWISSVFSFTDEALVPDSVHSIPLHSPMIDAESFQAICDLNMLAKAFQICYLIRIFINAIHWHSCG